MNRLASLLVCAAATLIAAAAAAQDSDERLPNGLRLVARNHPGLPLVYAGLYTGSGSDADPADRQGLTQLMIGMLWAGAGELDEDQVLAQLQLSGAESSAAAAVESAHVGVEALASRFPAAAELLLQAACTPRFDAAVLERRRNEAIARIAKHQEDPGYLAQRRFYEELMPGHAYGRAAEGTPETLAAITRDDVVAHHRRLLQPRHCVLYLLGPLQAEHLSLVRKWFGAWSMTDPPARPQASQPRIEPQRGRRVVFVDKPGATQSYIRIGNLAPAESDERFAALQVIDAVLAGGFTSVLIDDLRVNKGLVYSVNMARNRLSAPSPYAVVTATKASSTVPTIQGVLDGLRRIRVGEVTEAQVSTARNLVAGRFPQQLEGHAQLAAFLFEAERLGLGEQPQQELVRRLRAVDTAAVDAAASCFDPDHVLIVVVGDAKHVDRDALKQFEE